MLFSEQKHFRQCRRPIKKFEHVGATNWLSQWLIENRSINMFFIMLRNPTGSHFLIGADWDCLLRPGAIWHSCVELYVVPRLVSTHEAAISSWISWPPLLECRAWDASWEWYCGGADDAKVYNFHFAGSSLPKWNKRSRSGLSKIWWIDFIFSGKREEIDSKPNVIYFVHFRFDKFLLQQGGDFLCLFWKKPFHTVFSIRPAHWWKCRNIGLDNEFTPEWY